jgi:hypothetical protein
VFFSRIGIHPGSQRITGTPWRRSQRNWVSRDTIATLVAKDRWLPVVRGLDGLGSTSPSSMKQTLQLTAISPRNHPTRQLEQYRHTTTESQESLVSCCESRWWRLGTETSNAKKLRATPEGRDPSSNLVDPYLLKITHQQTSLHLPKHPLAETPVLQYYTARQRYSTSHRYLAHSTDMFKKRLTGLLNRTKSMRPSIHLQVYHL